MLLFPLFPRIGFLETRFLSFSFLFSLLCLKSAVRNFRAGLHQPSTLRKVATEVVRSDGMVGGGEEKVDRLCAVRLRGGKSVSAIYSLSPQ